MEQFQTLSSGYTEEQAKVADEIPAKEAAIQELRDTVSSAGFIAKVKRYIDIGYISGGTQQNEESLQQEISA